MLDVLVVGAGPTGRALAAACGERGLHTELLDPSPGRPWRATYGAWSDELPHGFPTEVIAATARGHAVARTEHQLDRDYSVLDVAAFRAHLDVRLAAAGVLVRRGRARYGSLPEAGVVVDAGGGAQPLAHRGGGRRNVHAEQTAVGLVVSSQVAAPLVRPGEALFMDWRPPDGARRDPDAWPTFLYAVPLGADRVLVEETSLARRPGLGFDALEGRLRARLAHHGIRPPRDAPREFVRFPLDLPRHRTPGVLGFGAAAPLTHAATGYQLATALRLAPFVATALADGLTDGPSGALRRARRALWSPSARMVHLLRRRGLESLLRLPPARLPEFFEGFFALPAHRQRAYLSDRDDALGTLSAMAGLFHTTSWPLRLRLVGFSLAAGVVSPIGSIPGSLRRH